MSDLTIAWEYLTGYCVASHPSRRDRAEWPPHPARVYMALAAAWFESEPIAEDKAARKDHEAEGGALRWLEGLGDPEISLPRVDREFERTNVDVFVPINDSAGPSAAILQSAPTLTRDKQPRCFPRVYVGDDPCVLLWRDVNDLETHQNALSQLCSKVTRIGHSSSMVSMWVATNDEHPRTESDSLIPDVTSSDMRARTIPNGFLDILTDRFGKECRDQHELIGEQIEQLKTQKNNVKGKGAKEAKAEIDSQVETLEVELAKISFQPAVRPTTSSWSGYRKQTLIAHKTLAHSGFDTDVLVLVGQRDLRLSAESTLLATETLRRTIMSVIPDPVPNWITGHRTSGEPLQDGVGHIACFPLLSSGFPYSDGHLLGVGIVFPRTVSRQDRGLAMRSLLVEPHGSQKEVRLKFGRLGEWSLVPRDWTEERVALKPETWTAAPNGRMTWASVTPVVLDRFPKADRIKQRTQWTDEVIGLVAKACENVGLPRPADIDVDTTSWQSGSPRALQKRRPLRGQDSSSTNQAALGNGFPAYPAKSGNGSKPQVHVWLRFSEAVVGPVILGAGRYLGYGLCMPWSEPR